MISRRNLVLGTGMAAFLSALPSLAQQGKVPRIGILSARSRSTPENPDPLFDAFMRGMRELGYVEGKNVTIEWRFADGKYERLPALAVELVGLRPDVIVSHTTPGTRDLQRVTQTIPIVVTSVSDPIASGFTSSFARPDKNVTGLSIATVDLSPKQVELMKIMLPSISKVGVLVDPAISFHAAVLKSVQTSAKKVGLQAVPVSAGNLQEIERAFETMAREGVTAAIVPANSLYTQLRRQIADYALRKRIATLVLDQTNVQAGALMAYGANTADSYRRAATYVDKILKGARPGDLPIEQPTEFHLIINLKTAKALKLRVPQELLDRASELIE